MDGWQDRSRFLVYLACGDVKAKLQLALQSKKRSEELRAGLIEILAWF